MSTPTAAAPAAPVTTASLIAETPAAAPAESKNEAPKTAEVASETESDETLADPADQPAKKPTAEQEKKSNKKKLKLKVDGVESEEEFDLDNEEELIKHLQLSKVAQKRMGEKATLEKQMTAFLEMLQANPEQAMRDIGLDPEDFAVKTLQKKIADEQKSPEQRELEKLKKELEDHRAKQKRDEDERKASEFARLQQDQEKKIEDGMIASLEKHKLPNQPLVVKRMADVMLTALENNIDIDAIEAGEIVKRELEADMKGYISALPDEALEAFLGKERLVGMRKKQVQAIKKAADTAASVKPTGNSVPKKEEKQAKKISVRDFLGS